MRRVLSLALLVGLLLVPSYAARAHHAPQSYCSESGDVCQEVKKTQEDYRFKLTLAAKYFNRYKLCVTGPETTDCRTFRVRQLGNGTYGGDVSWVKHYPPQGTGAYTVVWKQGGGKLGRKLGFHVR
jgi:hypothetical protein